MVTSLLSSRFALEPGFHNRAAELIVRRLSAGKEAFPRQSRKPLSVWHPSAGLTPYGYRYAERALTRSGNVVVFPIIGGMSRYGGLCSYGTEDMANWIRAANADDTVSAIVLEINSPGGEVDGTGALGAAVKASKKPVVAWVAGMAASAAYWVASQAREIVAEDATASEVGSIGVLAMHVDQSAALEAEGYKVTILRSDGSEDKALFNSVEPLTPEITATVKASLNAIRDQFIQTVKAGRPGISGDVFSGKMFTGKEAKAKKMIDRFGSLLDAISRADQLARKDEKSSSQSQSAMNLNHQLAGLFGVPTADADNVSAEALAAIVVSADMHKTTLAERDEATKKVAGLESQVTELTGERDTAQASLKAYSDLGATAEEAKTALSWYAEHKKAGGVPPGDESENQPDKKRVSKATQAAIDAKKRQARK